MLEKRLLGWINIDNIKQRLYYYFASVTNMSLLFLIVYFLDNEYATTILFIFVLLILVPPTYPSLQMSKGKSMEPTIPGGFKYVFQMPEGGESLQTGDIIVFKNQEDFILHRIVGKTNSGYITKGDGNSAVDPSVVQPEQVIAKVPTIFGTPIYFPVSVKSYIVTFKRIIFFWK